MASVTETNGRWMPCIRFRPCTCSSAERVGAVHHWARTAVHHDPVRRARHRALRNRGHGDARALRSVADRLRVVAYALLANQTMFDPSSHGSLTSHERARHARCVRCLIRGGRQLGMARQVGSGLESRASKCI